MLKICLDLFKTCLKIYCFCQHLKKAKKGQMAKPFYFWQTVLKRAKWQPCFTRHCCFEVQKKLEKNKNFHFNFLAQTLPL